MRMSFEYAAGCLALDFVDTVAVRNGDARDLLSSPDALLRWLEGAGLQLDLPGPLLADIMTDARALREALYRSFGAVSEGAAPSATDLTAINMWAALPRPRPQLADGVVRYLAVEPAEILSLIAADAVENLQSDLLSRVRRCPDCEMLFQDNSRPQNRIWCSSTSRCGNRAKVRRHRAAKAKG